MRLNNNSCANTGGRTCGGCIGICIYWRGRTPLELLGCASAIITGSLPHTLLTEVLRVEPNMLLLPGLHVARDASQWQMPDSPCCSQELLLTTALGKPQVRMSTRIADPPESRTADHTTTARPTVLNVPRGMLERRWWHCPQWQHKGLRRTSKQSGEGGNTSNSPADNSCHQGREGNPERFGGSTRCSNTKMWFLHDSSPPAWGLDTGLVGAARSGQTGCSGLGLAIRRVQ